MSPIVPALLVVSVGLAAGLAYEIAAPIPAVAIPAVPTPRVHVGRDGGPSFAPSPLAAYAIVNLKPLFNATRQPILEPSDESIPGAGPPGLTLVGVMIGQGRAMALLRDVGGARLVPLGGTFQGWQLTAVEPGRVVLRADGNDLELRLKASGTTTGTITIVPSSRTVPLPAPRALPSQLPIVQPADRPPVYLGPPGTNRRHPG